MSWPAVSLAASHGEQSLAAGAACGPDEGVNPAKFNEDRSGPLKQDLVVTCERGYSWLVVDRRGAVRASSEGDIAESGFEKHIEKRITDQEMVLRCATNNGTALRRRSQFRATIVSAMKRICPNGRALTITSRQ